MSEQQNFNFNKKYFKRMFEYLRIKAQREERIAEIIREEGLRNAKLITDKRKWLPKKPVKPASIGGPTKKTKATVPSSSILWPKTIQFQCEKQANGCDLLVINGVKVEPEYREIVQPSNPDNRES